MLSRVDEDGRPRDGFLRIDDVAGLELDAELVVLSGCQTALGREIRGEGLVGLTRGFMYAGVPRVLASLWRVQDRATARLMDELYRAMWAEGRRPAAALRAAQLTIRRDSEGTLATFQETLETGGLFVTVEEGQARHDYAAGALCTSYIMNASVEEGRCDDPGGVLDGNFPGDPTPGPPRGEPGGGRLAETHGNRTHPPRRNRRGTTVLKTARGTSP